MKVSINYTGGAHGNFLEMACNYIFFKIGIPPIDRVTHNGTYHKDLSDNEQILYNFKKKFVAFPFWWLHPHPVTQNWPKVPYPLEQTIVNINSKSIEEIALLRMYWRRRGDGFFLSPSELLSTSKTEFIQKRDNTNYAIRWIAGEDLARSMRDLLASNALSLYKSDYLDEMTVIRFWMDPFLTGHLTDQEWMVDVNVKFIDSVKESHRVIEFPMKWFYNSSEFLSGIKMLSTELKMEQLMSDEEILYIIENLQKTLFEYPKQIALVMDKFESIKRHEVVDLSFLELNDKIMLVTLLNIQYKLWYKDYEHLNEFPKTSKEFIDMISNQNSLF